MKWKIIAILVTVSMLFVGIAAIFNFSEQKDGSNGIPIHYDWNVSYNNLQTFGSYQEYQDFLTSNEELSGYGYYSNLTKEEGNYYGGDFRFGNTAETVDDSSSNSGSSDDYSSTNVQVGGVDEGDIVKNDGKFAYIVSRNATKVYILDVFPPEQARILSTIEFDFAVREIYLNEDKLVVIGTNLQFYTYYRYNWYSTPQEAHINVYDIHDRENPELTRSIVLNGCYISSRIIGDYLYVIVTQPTSEIENEDDLPVPANEIYYTPDYDYYYSLTNIISVNVQNDNQQPFNKVILMGCSTHIYVSTKNIHLTYLKRMSWVEKMEKKVEEVIIPILPQDTSQVISEVSNEDTTRTEKLEKIDTIFGQYLDGLTEEDRDNFNSQYQKKNEDFERNIQHEIEKTTIHRIAIWNGKIEYMTSGAVPGYILNRYSMDEYCGYFRIATTTGHVSRNGDSGVSNHVFVLNMDLISVGGITDIAVGEKIYSARFMGKRGYLVTFKKVDPFFVLDLSNPTDPYVLGELKIPGYSNYLHPYDENHVIGIGKDTVPAQEGDFTWYQGVKLSLFDVTDVNNPKELAKYIIGDRGTHSLALDDPHAFLFSKDKNLLVIPILLAEIDESKYPEGYPPYTHGDYTYCGAYVFDISLKDGYELKGKISHCESMDPGSFSWYYDSPYQVKRSFYIEDYLYTVSGNMIKANSLDDLTEINTVELAG
ncbi:MAG: hypothetical protein A7315_06760 [Candidatus Altiarchaeales archaeon WOR_SM1_79]|nr:MAG: hypothetical protein A7315_06760 [Candidatus Altiarchaeales archaeon WOR_SM1_79]